MPYRLLKAMSWSVLTAPQRGSSSGATNAADHHGVERGVLREGADGPGTHGHDAVDDLHAAQDAAEDRVAPGLRGLGAVIERDVVRHVHEELRRGRVGIRGARHR